MTQEDWLWIESCRTKWRTDDPEEYYWHFVDCQEYGWRAEVMFSHHDGDMVVGESVRVTKDDLTLIEAARAAYADAFPGEKAPEITVSGFTHKRYGWELDESGYLKPVRN